MEHTHLPIHGINIHVAQVGKGESLAQILAWPAVIDSPPLPRSNFTLAMVGGGGGAGSGGAGGGGGVRAARARAAGRSSTPTRRILGCDGEQRSAAASREDGRERGVQE